ncbi:serine hydrolase domain-containing protein [Lactiplantibacillus daowaiensis]|uniref:Serine hydrolase domain-containing protein n=1 Tax=Lactiplantibacillus daowaiensis TaxID=2559918 RepID=A0ABW1RX79_9LACO|nr:serine hydrolase domain-containing protein [Lactiplantibacillus daowaiensis]
MTIKKVGILGMLGLASLGGSLLFGMPTSTATTRPVYLQLKPYDGKLAVYQQIPDSTSTLQNGIDAKVASDQVYRGTTTGSYLTFKYIHVQTLAGKSVGWLNRSDTKTLTHVTKDGLLTQYQTKKLAGQLKLTGKSKKVTVTVQGPQATKAKLTTKKVTSKTLTTSAYRVVKQSTTDFGKYYQLQKNSKNYGWVKSTGFKYTAKKATATKPKTTTLSATKAKQIDALVNAAHLKGTLLMTTAASKTPVIRSYGYANAATKTKNTATTIYPIASLQKAMTGTIIEQLIQAGKLSMTTPLSKYYPKVPYAKSITIAELLTHTSGITMPEDRPSKVLSETGALDWALANLTSTNEHTWHYSSANFTLLAGIIRQVTGKSYATNLQQRILTPAKMTQTYAVAKLPTTGVATPYAFDTADYDTVYKISKPLLSSELGAGDISMPVNDYYQFITAFNSGKLLSTTARAELTSVITTHHYVGGFYYHTDGGQHATGYDNHISNFYLRSGDGKVNVVGFWNQGDHVTAKTTMKQIEAVLAE